MQQRLFILALEEGNVLQDDFLETKANQCTKTVFFQQCWGNRWWHITELKSSSPVVRPVEFRL